MKTFKRTPFRTRDWLTVMTCALLVVGTAPLMSHAQGVAAAKRPKIIPVPKTLEASTSYLYVKAQVSDDGKVLTGKSDEAAALAQLGQIEGLDDLDAFLDGQGKPASSFTAFLDTGASAHALSRATAKRFKIEQHPTAVYHETGLHGQTPMGVSEAYSLAIAGTDGSVGQKAGRMIDLTGRIHFEINPKPANALVQMSFGEINVIGMPAIEQLVVEVDSSALIQRKKNRNRHAKELEDIEGIENLLKLGELEQLAAGPTVRLRHAAARDARPPAAEVDVVVPLKYVDFARRKNAIDKPPLPTMTANPMIESIKTLDDGNTFTGDWLLDTGAPISIISRKQAQVLDVLDENFKPTRASAFSVPLGGVGGAVTSTRGYRIARMDVPAKNGAIIRYYDVHVIVKDISTQLDSGETITLDGVFGTNLLLPTIGGLNGGFGLPDASAPPAFEKFWIDGPRGELLLKLLK